MVAQKPECEGAGQKRLSTEGHMPMALVGAVLSFLVEVVAVQGCNQPINDR